MISKRKIIMISTIFIICLISIVFIQNNNQKNDILISKKEENIISSNAISMLYETEVGSGEYQISNDTSWPSSRVIIFVRPKYLRENKYKVKVLYKKYLFMWYNYNGCGTYESFNYKRTLGIFNYKWF